MASGGYEYEFVPELPDEYICVICHLALRKPKQIEECGHRVCQSCFEVMKNPKTRNEMQCPIDREHFTENQIFKDKGTERSIVNWKIKCPNNSNCCEWVGGMNTVQNHEKRCYYSKEKLCSKNKAQIKKLQDELLNVKEQLEALKNERNAITSSEDPRSLKVISNCFEWKCPMFDITVPDANYYSPKIYYRQYCFCVNFYTDSAAANFCVLLERCRGKFDDPEERIKDVLSDDFEFIVTLRGRMKSIKNIVVTRKSTWIIEAGRQTSDEKDGRVLFELLECSNDFIVDGFYHLQCRFCGI